MTSKRSYDAIVIGGGHNGLVNGAYLAKSGLKTLIIDVDPVLSDKLWQLYDFKTVQTDASASGPYLSLKGQREYDCAEERDRTLTATWFSGNMGHGSLVQFDSDEKKWQPVPPSSINQILWKLACAKK